MMVFTMKMEILLEPTLNKLLVGSFKDGDGDGDTQFQQCQVNNQIPRHDLHLLWSYERSHKGVKASANSEIINFFTSAQDGDALQDDVRLCLADDLMKAQNQNQSQVNHKSKDHYRKKNKISKEEPNVYELKNEVIKFSIFRGDLP
ncbi:hypothetical protein Tco_0449569 [Tanacetum coccineum]